MVQEVISALQAKHLILTCKSIQSNNNSNPGSVLYINGSVLCVEIVLTWHRESFLHKAKHSFPMTGWAQSTN